MRPKILLVALAGTVLLAACRHGSEAKSDAGDKQITFGYYDAGPDSGMDVEPDAGVDDAGEDAGVMDAGVTPSGCGQVNKCFLACSRIDFICEENCIAQGTDAGQTLFDGLLTCLDLACPPQDGGICNGSNVTDCEGCWGATEQARGTCATPFTNCMKDLSGDFPPASCGDGICQPSESNESCCEDCACPAGLECMSGTCASPCGPNVSCEACGVSDGGTCGWCFNTMSCISGSESGSVDGTCSGTVWAYGEPACSILSTCGNGHCDPGENMMNCCADCGCAAGMVCAGGNCEPGACRTITNCDSCVGDTSCGWCLTSNKCSEGTASGSNLGLCTGRSWAFGAPSACDAGSCGDGVCGPGESMSNCCQDCPCTGGGICGADGGACIIPCDTHNICRTCTNESNCGWCSTSSTCEWGSVAGPDAGDCSLTDWTYLQSQCGVVVDAGQPVDAGMIVDAGPVDAGTVLDGGP